MKHLCSVQLSIILQQQQQSVVSTGAPPALATAAEACWQSKVQAEKLPRGLRHWARGWVRPHGPG